MSLTDQLRQAHGQLTSALPHRDTLTLPGKVIQGPRNEYGELPPPTVLPGPSWPCHAARLTAEDAVRAGLSGSAEVWRVVVNAANAFTSTDAPTLTLSSGESVSLTVTQVSGTSRTVALCQRST